MLVLRRKFVDDFFEEYLKQEEEEVLDTVNLSLPGVGKDNIEVYGKKENILVVKWKTKNDKHDTVNKREFEVIPFKSANASYTDGVLNINLEPKEEEKPLKIKIA